MSHTFDSLAEAVRASFPPSSCRVVAVREHGDAAVALFDTSPTADPYLYEVHYHRDKGGWSESTSGNGPGWHFLGPQSDVGAVTLWDKAPPDADRVRAEFGGKVFEESTDAGVYMFAWWGVPCSAAQVIGFRTHGEWVRAP